jgi:hypothetical protein
MENTNLSLESGPENSKRIALKARVVHRLLRALIRQQLLERALVHLAAGGVTPASWHAMSSVEIRYT